MANTSKATDGEIETARHKANEARNDAALAMHLLGSAAMGNDAIEMAHMAIVRAARALDDADRTLRVAVNRIKRERGA